MNHELPDVQDGFRKDRGTRDQIDNIRWIIVKTREFQKTSISALLTTAKTLTVLITTNCGKSFKRWDYHTIAVISYASKVVLKIHQARPQQYVNHELPDVQAGFRKGRGNTDQIANICWIMEKAREFQKNIYFCFIDDAKAFTVWITINCGKF